MENNGVVREIFVDSNHPERMRRPEAKGLRHIAFTVDSLEVVMNNVPCEGIRTDWFGRRFTFTKDLDGQPIEIKKKKRIKRCTKEKRENELFSGCSAS